MNACARSGKEQFATAAAAYKRIGQLQARKRDRMDDKFSRGPLTAYRCRYCHFFHAGHQPNDKSRHFLRAAKEARHVYLQSF